MLDDDLFTPVPTQMDTEMRVIGNTEGVAMFTEHVEMRGLVEKIMSELSDVKKFNTGLQQSVEDLQQSVKNLHEKNASLAKSNEKLQKSVDDLQELVDELRS